MLTFTPSVNFVTITILQTFSCQIICQKSFNVIFFGPGMQSIQIWLHMYCPWWSNYLEIGVSLYPNLDFYRHMPWSFICSIRLGERWASLLTLSFTITSFPIEMNYETVKVILYFNFLDCVTSGCVGKSRSIFKILNMWSY